MKTFKKISKTTQNDLNAIEWMLNRKLTKSERNELIKTLPASRRAAQRAMK